MGPQVCASSVPGVRAPKARYERTPAVYSEVYPECMSLRFPPKRQPHGHGKPPQDVDAMLEPLDPANGAPGCAV